MVLQACVHRASMVQQGAMPDLPQHLYKARPVMTDCLDAWLMEMLYKARSVVTYALEGSRELHRGST